MEGSNGDRNMTTATKRAITHPPGEKPLAVRVAQIELAAHAVRLADLPQEDGVLDGRPHNVTCVEGG